jgi:hypothetical protein
LEQDEVEVKAAVLTSRLPAEGQNPAKQAPIETHYVPVPKATRAFCSGQEASYHAMASSCIPIKNFGSVAKVLPNRPIEYSWLYQVTAEARRDLNARLIDGSVELPALEVSVTRLDSEVVVFRVMLRSRKWLVVWFRDPFAQTVPDRVEVPPTAHCTGVKPQFGFLFQLLNFFRAQTADALF